MCRLFALHAGRTDVRAEFWLLDAPDSIARQSESNADGYGMASLTSADGLMLIRNPVQAVSSSTFEGLSRWAKACQYLVHLRYADTGSVGLQNTHPFFQDGRVFAHNGVVGDLEKLDERLGDARWMINGETDSERFFGLITLSIREAGGDVRAGITAAVNELASDYELYSLNFIMATRGHLWAFRYPEHNPLHVLQHDGGCALEADSSFGNMSLHTTEAAAEPLVLVSSEQMDDSGAWEEVRPGELIHVGPDLELEREVVVDGPPAHQMVLKGTAAKSQAYERDEAAAA